LVLKVCSEFDDVTSAGKLFHVRVASTGNARSLTVDSRVDGTSITWDCALCSCALQAMTARESNSLPFGHTVHVCCPKRSPPRHRNLLLKMQKYLLT